MNVKTLKQTVKMLRAAGADYAIISPEGIYSLTEGNRDFMLFVKQDLSALSLITSITRRIAISLDDLKEASKMMRSLSAETDWIDHGDYLEINAGNTSSSIPILSVLDSNRLHNEFTQPVRLDTALIASFLQRTSKPPKNSTPDIFSKLSSIYLLENSEGITMEAFTLSDVLWIHTYTSCDSHSSSASKVLSFPRSSFANLSKIFAVIKKIDSVSISLSPSNLKFIINNTVEVCVRLTQCSLFLPDISVLSNQFGLTSDSLSANESIQSYLKLIPDYIHKETYRSERGDILILNSQRCSSGIVTSH